MYLRTPKRYTPKGRRQSLINFRWLWLYLIALPIILISALAWELRAPLSNEVGKVVGRIEVPVLFAPTATPTLPARDLESRIQTTLSNGAMKDAMQAMQDYGRSMPNDVRWSATLTEMLIMRNPTDPKQRSDAMTAASRTINANPEAAEGYTAMALVLDWSDQPGKALSYALRAREITDLSGATNPMVLAVIGGVYVTLNDYPTATKFAKDAIKIEPNTAYAYYVLGQIAQYSGQPKEAINWYRQGVEVTNLDKSQWGGYLVLALAGMYSGQNDFNRAIALLNEALERDRDYAPLYGRLADIYYKQGAYDRSQETALSCIDRVPDYSYCYVMATKLFYRDGLFEKSAQSAQRAVALQSQETSVYFFGGEAFRKLNRCVDAVPLFNAGLALADRLNKDSAKSDFVAALADCGVTANLAIIPTATPIPTETPVKKK